MTIRVRVQNLNGGGSGHELMVSNTCLGADGEWHVREEASVVLQDGEEMEAHVWSGNSLVVHEL